MIAPVTRMTVELIERSTEPIVRARCARRGVTGPLLSARSRGARPMRRETRELAAPSTMRLIVRWMRNREARQSRTISATENVVDTIASAERARKSLLVHW
jgi:hypothetical protein